MANFHIIKCSYSGATNFRGSRVVLKSERFESSISLPYDHSMRDSIDIGIKYLKEQGFKISGYGEASNGYYIVSTTFKDIKKVNYKK